MDKEISLKIEFSNSLSDKEQMEFWDSLIDQLEKLNLRAGGGNDSMKLDWVIDYSYSKLDKDEIIDGLGDFLLNYDEQILNFKIG